jgi:hypothetical protein
MLEVAQLRVQLALLDDRLVQWSKADQSLFEQRHHAGATLQQIVSDIHADRRTRVEDGVADPQHELFGVLDGVTDTYLAADDRQRGAIRGAFNGKDRVLLALETYVSRAADALAASGELVWLRRGLAAASILDVRLDPQDIQVSLGNLYRAAALTGLDPAPVFADVASLSSDAYPGRFGSARALLAGFHQSDYFRQSVAPDL